MIYFGFKSVQPQEPTVDHAFTGQVNDKSIRENLQNLFESIAKSDTEWQGIYRETLNRKIMKNRQAFNAMKEKLQMARLKNGLKRRSLYRKRNAIKNNMALKRETRGNYRKLFDPRKVEEDEWITQYGVDEAISGIWEALLNIKGNVSILQELCAQCHSKVYDIDTSKVRVTEVYVSDWLLTFPHSKVESIRATMAMYATSTEQAQPNQKIQYFYFIKGTRPDCVMYVKETKETKMEFRFWKQVCGIQFPELMRAYDSSEDDDQSYNESEEETSPKS